jgi:hypothetical protein
MTLTKAIKFGKFGAKLLQKTTSRRTALRWLCDPLNKQ